MLNGEHDRFDADGRNEYTRFEGAYQIVEDAVEGYTATYGGACDAQGNLTLTSGGAVVCTITNTAPGWKEGDPEVRPVATATPTPAPVITGGGSGSSAATGTLVVQKIILLSSVSYARFGFSVASQTAQFDADGIISLSLNPGSYVVKEFDTPGYTTVYGGACDALGAVTVASGQTATCTITNTLGVGGFNPGSTVPAPTPTPTPTPTRAAPSARAVGGTIDRSLESVDALQSPSPSPSVSVAPSSDEESNQVAAAGVLLGVDLCSNAGHIGWWVTLIAVSVVLLWFGRRRGALLWFIIAAVILWTLWAWTLCGFGFVWLPLLLGAIVWLLSAPQSSSR
jgi:hypothetical protein